MIAREAQPGRKLDVLIALTYPMEDICILDPGTENERAWWNDSFGGKEFSPSTDIAAAWKVSEYLRIFDRRLLGKAGDVWQLYDMVSYEGLWTDMEADTFPLLISRFAVWGLELPQ